MQVVSAPSTLFARQSGNDTDVDDFPNLPISSDFIEIVGPAFPGGPDITFTGSPEDFYKKVTALNPSYDSDFAADIAAEASASDEDLTESAHHHAAFCFHDNYAHTDAIRSGIHYLKSLHARCGSVRNFCTRVSCSYNSGIYLCNDVRSENVLHLPFSRLLTLTQQTFHKIAPHCGFIAKLSSHGLDVCANGNNVQTHIRSGDSWRVWIQGADC